MAGETTEIKKEAEEISQSVVPISSEIVTIEKSVEQADRYLKVLNQIRLLAIKLTNISDWTNEAGHPYLQKSGCDKIAGAFGVQIFDTEFIKEICKDDKGEYIMFTCTGNGRWNNHEESEIGTCSTRDDFFGKKGGEYKPLSEVDLTDVKKKAFTNMANRLIKKLIGLSFTWEEIGELSESKITAKTVQKVEYGKGSRGGNTDSPQTKAKRNECRTMLMKLNNNDTKLSQEMLKRMTTFKGKDGNMVPGKDNVDNLSEAALDVLHGKLKHMVADADAALEAGQRG